MSREWPLFLADMLDFCQRILEFSEGLEFEEFARGNRDRDALLLNIILLGEAASHVPEEIRSTWKEVPWREIVATRNALVHGYFAMSDAILWDIVTKEIPALLPRLQRILEQHPAD